MDRDELQSMTVAQLKILLEENSLSKSGKKSDLIDRLLENSFSLDEEEDFLILEEEDFDDELEITKSSPSTPSDEKIEIMEATILEAVLVEDDQTPDTPSMKVREPTSKKSEPMIEIKIHAGKPRKAVVLGIILLGAVVAGGGYWWTWVQDQQSFTTEPSRYGDTMSFTMTDGQISAVYGNPMI